MEVNLIAYFQWGPVNKICRFKYEKMFKINALLNITKYVIRCSILKILIIIPKSQKQVDYYKTI